MIDGEVIEENNDTGDLDKEEELDVAPDDNWESDTDFKKELRTRLRAVFDVIHDVPKAEELGSLFEEQASGGMDYQTHALMVESMLDAACRALDDNDVKIPTSVVIWWEQRNKNLKKASEDVLARAHAVKESRETE
jgi:hypothetical protein